MITGPAEKILGSFYHLEPGLLGGCHVGVVFHHFSILLMFRKSSLFHWEIDNKFNRNCERNMLQFHDGKVVFLPKL